MAVTLTVGLFLTAPFFISLFFRSFFQSPNNFIICVSLLSKLNHHVQSKLKLIRPNKFQFLLLKRIFKPWERKMKFKSIFFCDEYDSKNCNPRSLYKPLDRNVKLRLKFWLMWQLQAYVAFQTLTQEPAYLFLWLIIADSFFVWQYFVPPIEWCLVPLSKHFFPPRECCLAPFSNYYYPSRTVLFWATEGSYYMLIYWHACWWIS